MAKLIGLMTSRDVDCRIMPSSLKSLKEHLIIARHVGVNYNHCVSPSVSSK